MLGHTKICHLDDASWDLLHQEDVLHLEVLMADILAILVDNGWADLKLLKFDCFFSQLTNFL